MSSYLPRQAPPTITNIHVDAPQPTPANIQPPPRFLPREAYELLAALIKVDERLAKSFIQLLLGKSYIRTEEGEELRSLTDGAGNHAKPFCNWDGFVKLSQLLLLHVGTPLSYSVGQSPRLHAAETGRQVIRDIAANFDIWEISTPSLIPQISAIFYEYVFNTQAQSTDMMKDMTGGGLLAPHADNKVVPAAEPISRVR